MSYYSRFGENYPEEMRRVYAMRGEVTEQSKRLAPSNLEAVVEASDSEDPSVKLQWVKVPDPRTTAENSTEIEVLPVLPIEWVEGDGDHEPTLGVSSLMLMGRLPSGDEDLIGVMYLSEAGDNIGPEPYLFLKMGDDKNVYTRWDSADAELFLILAKSALDQQPTA